MANRQSILISGTLSGTLISGQMPVQVVPGDRLIAFITVDSSSVSILAPSPWVQIGTVSNSASSPDGQIATVFEIPNCTGEESCVFYTSATSTADFMAVIHAFSNRHVSTASQVVSTLNTTSNTTPVALSFTGLTAVAGDDLLLANYLDCTVTGDVWTHSTVSGFTQQQQRSFDFTTTQTQTLDNSAGGATGALTCTATRSSGTGNAGYAGFVIAIPKSDTVITQQPTRRFNTQQYSTVIMDVTATGTGGLTYQWQKKLNNKTFINISGATSSSYTTPSLVINDHKARYRCLVTSTIDSQYSAFVSLDVTALNYVPRNKKIVKHKSCIFDLSGKGWFSAELVQPIGLFSKDSVTLVTSTDVTVSVTGQQITFGSGNTSANNNILTTGQQVISSVGQVTATIVTDVSINVTGQQIGLTQDNVGLLLSVPLIGQQSTSVQNQLVINNVVNTTGQQVTLTQGNINKSLLVANLGQVSNSSQGQNIANILSNQNSQSSNVNLGNLTSNISKALIGQSSSISQGILIAALQLNIVGQNVIASQGSVSVSISSNAISVSIIGQEISCNSGIIGVISSAFPVGIITSSVIGNTILDMNINALGSTINNNLGVSIPYVNSLLVGQNINSNQGNLLVNTDVNILGQNINVVQTNVIPTNNISLVGSGVSISQGSISIALGNDIFINAIGQEVGLSIGTLVPSLDKQVTGQESTLNQENIFSSVNVATSTNQLTFTQGNQSVNVSLNGLGQTLSSHQGILTLNIIGLVNERGYNILPENRLFVINLENRLYTILPEDRRYII